jgi:Helix-turn-helix domain
VPEIPAGYDARRYRLTPDARLRLTAEGLKPLTLLLLDALVDHDWADKDGRRKGYCWPKAATLARLCHVTERTVRTHLCHLIRAGLIARVGNGGRGLPAVATLNWPRIIGENPDRAVTVCPAETRIHRSAPRKPSKTKNQEKAAASASAPEAAPPRRVRYTEPEAVPCPPEVCAALRELFGRIGATTRPAPMRTELVDRRARDEWRAAQWAQAREMGLA